MDAHERKRLARTISWDELLGKLHFEKGGTKFKDSIEVTNWVFDSVSGPIHFQTWGKDETLFLADENGPVIPYKGIPKYELLRATIFDGSTKHTDDFLESNRPLEKTVLDAIAEEYKAFLIDEFAHLPVKERKWHDTRLSIAIESEIRRLEAQAEAKVEYAERQSAFELPTPSGQILSAFLTKELAACKWRVEGLIQAGSTVTVVAPFKTGKSTFNFNLIECLITGADFLGVFPTEKIEGRVGFLNYELTEEQCQEWFRRIGISDPSKVIVWNLRGEPNPFRSDQSIEKFGRECLANNVQFLFGDPLSSLYPGEDLNKNEEVKQFLLKVESFKTKFQVGEVLISVHAGKDLKTRGAGTLDDHPDAIVRLNKQADGTRTIRAEGRDVELPETELLFDKETLTLTIGTAISPASKIERLSTLVLDAVIKAGKVTATDLPLLVGRSRDDVKRARDLLVTRGDLIETKIDGYKFFCANSKLVASMPSTASASLAVASPTTAETPFKGSAVEASVSNPLACPEPSHGDFSKFQIEKQEIVVCWDCVDFCTTSEG